MSENLIALLSQVRQLQSEGVLPTKPTIEQYADWAHGQTAFRREADARACAEAAAKKIATR